MPRWSLTKTRPHRLSKPRIEPSSINFDAFTFVDNITNTKITMSEARNKYSHQNRRASEQKPSEHAQREINNINECISTLKSTKLFQMDSLRHKIFKTLHQPKKATNQEQHLKQTKRELRDLIEMSIDQASVQQLRQCLANRDKKVDPHVMSMQSLTGHQFSKAQLLKLMTGIKKKPKQTATAQQKRRKPCPDDSFQLQQQCQLRQRMQNYLNNTIRCNSSYLVKPSKHKELFEKLYKACTSKNNKNQSPFTQVAALQGQGVFRPIDRGQKAAGEELKLKKRAWAKKSPQQEEIIHAVQNDLFFDIDMSLMLRPQLAHTRDRMGNGLLHLAAKTRNEELFSYLMKKIGPGSLVLRNNMGRTPLQLAKMYGAQGIVNICQNPTL